MLSIELVKAYIITLVFIDYHFRDAAEQYHHAYMHGDTNVWCQQLTMLISIVTSHIGAIMLIYMVTPLCGVTMHYAYMHGDTTV